MNKTKETDEITIEEVTLKFNMYARYLRQKARTLLLVALIGAGLGFGYSLIIKATYTAQATFVLEDASKSSFSQYSTLASLAGVSLGNASGELFDQTNILALYKTRLMIAKALLSEAVFNNKKQLLIDRYADMYHIRNRWKEKDHIDNINFYGDPAKFNRQQDSIITSLVVLFNKKYLTVNKLEKDLSIIKVEFTSRDELFSQAFTKILVQTVNNFYVQTKTQKADENLAIIQRQVDSLKKALNIALNSAASAQDANPNANPLLTSLRVPSQKKQIDVQASVAEYTELVKNLEISKISLRNERPLIQVIDSPILPLKTDKPNKIVCILIGMLLFPIMYSGILLIKKAYNF